LGYVFVLSLFVSFSEILWLEKSSPHLSILNDQKLESMTQPVLGIFCLMFINALPLLELGKQLAIFSYLKN